MANFRIYIADLTYDQNAEVPEQQKFAYLKELLTHDARQYLANALELARFSKLDFESTVDLLITTHSNQPTGSVRMGAMGSVSYCFDFQKGECIKKNWCSLIPYYMYMYSMYIYIYTLYGIQDPGPCIHVIVYPDPYPVPHETTNTVYH